MTAELPRTTTLQDAARMSRPAATILRDGAGMAWRRLAFAGPVAALTAAGTAVAISATVTATADTQDMLRWPLIVLLAANLLYMALTGWPGVLGGLVRLGGRRSPAWAEPTGESRTAVIMPIYEEDPATVFGAMEAMARAIAASGLRDVDLFVLSDTQSPAAAAVEAATYAAMRARLPEAIGMPAVRYRRRTRNVRRKVGNIADFCAEWGRRYDYMVVLDADSLMGAATLRTLIGLMDAHPRAGIIQTIPYPVGRETPFARAQQFAARLYTPMLAEGLRFWQGSDANYWGHNAIVRIAPFVQHCELPVLPGREPFGGEILCHDVVEAGLMRAAGWDVWVLPDEFDSFEALPANLVDYCVRERRWCQGNLQHAGLLGRPGLRPVGRFHLGYGILTYLAGPAAALFLLLATADLLAGGGAMAAMIGSPALAALVLTLLYASKLVSLAAALLDGEQARRFGGRWSVLRSAAGEQLGAFISAPVLIVFYTRFALSILTGHSVRWDAQARDDRGVGWAEAWRRMRLPTLIGAVWLAALGIAGGTAVLWAAPLWLGLLLATPAAVWSSRSRWGVALRQARVFATPEELTPPAILRAVHADRTVPRHPKLRLVVPFEKRVVQSEAD